HHFGVGSERAYHRLGRVDRLGLDEPPVVRAHRVQPGVARVEVSLEDLDALLRDHRAPDPAHQLLALAGEHHAGDHLDPAGAGTVEHGRPCSLASWRLATGGGERVVGGGRWVKEVPVSCGLRGWGLIWW